MSQYERRESQHEYNMFLDRPIQDQLLALNEQTVDVASTNKNGRSSYKDICAWGDDFSLRQPQPEKTVSSKNSKEAKPDSVFRDRDMRTREKSYAFRHYQDTRQYMEQYRKENSSCSSRNSSGDSRQVLSDQQVQMLFQKHQHVQALKRAEMARVTNNMRAEANAAKLAYKYRLSPSVKKQIELDDLNSIEGRRSTLNRSRASSAKSVSEVNTKKKGGVSHQLRRIPIVQATKMPAAVLTNVQSANQPPNGQQIRFPSPHEHSGANETSLELVKQEFLPRLKLRRPAAGASRMAEFHIPSNNIKTLDLLSSVSAVDKQEEIADGEETGDGTACTVVSEGPAGETVKCVRSLLDTSAGELSGPVTQADASVDSPVPQSACSTSGSYGLLTSRSNWSHPRSAVSLPILTEDDEMESDPEPYERPPAPDIADKRTIEGYDPTYQASYKWRQWYLEQSRPKKGKDITKFKLLSKYFDLHRPMTEHRHFRRDMPECFQKGQSQLRSEHRRLQEELGLRRCGTFHNYSSKLSPPSPLRKHCKSSVVPVSHVVTSMTQYGRLQSQTFSAGTERPEVKPEVRLIPPAGTRGQRMQQTTDLLRGRSVRVRLDDGVDTFSYVDVQKCSNTTNHVCFCDTA